MADDDAVPTRRIERVGHLGLFGARQGMARAWLALSRLGRSADAQASQEALHHRAQAEALTALLGSMRGLVTKLGQIVSFVDTSFLPEAHADTYRLALSSLRDQAPAMSYARVAALLEAEHGKRPEALFAAFEETPFAAASVGQVHRAVLPDGRRVVVKVQYEGMAESIAADLDNAHLFSHILPLIAPGLDGPALLTEARRALLEELDYRAEARHQARFHALYDGHPWVLIPRPVPTLCTARSLVIEEARGASFAELCTRSREERDRAGEILYRFAFGSLFRRGFFNADTHPGNYAFRDDGKVVFYDFGAVKDVPEGALIDFKNMTGALMWGDVQGLYEDCCLAGFVRDPKRVHPARLYAYLELAAGPLVSARGPVTVTRDWVRRVVAATSDPRAGHYDLVRHLNVHPESFLIGRMQLGIMAVLAQLEATAPFGDIAREWVLDHEPATELGREDARFFAQRG